MRSFSHKALADTETATLITSIDDGGESLRIFRVSNLEYHPATRLTLIDGIIPAEIIDHHEHAVLAFSGRFRRAQAQGRHWLKTGTIFDTSRQEVCILATPHSANFFHWLETLLKVVAMQEAGFSGRYVVAANLPSFCFEFLDLLGIAGDRLESPRVPTQYRSAWICEGLNLFNISRHPRILTRLREILREKVEFRGGGPERLWIERNNVERRLVNAAELAPHLAEAGFVSIDLAQFNVRDQLALTLTARAIAGPHGAGLAHCAFMPPDGFVLEAFSPNHLYPCLLDVCQASGHRYHMIAGCNAPWQNYAHGMDVHVEVEQLRLALART